MREDKSTGGARVREDKSTGGAGFVFATILVIAYWRTKLRQLVATVA